MLKRIKWKTEAVPVRPWWRYVGAVDVVAECDGFYVSIRVTREQIEENDHARYGRMFQHAEALLQRHMH